MLEAHKHDIATVYTTHKNTRQAPITYKLNIRNSLLMVAYSIHCGAKLCDTHRHMQRQYNKAYRWHPCVLGVRRGAATETATRRRRCFHNQGLLALGEHGLLLQRRAWQASRTLSQGK